MISVSSSNTTLHTASCNSPSHAATGQYLLPDISFQILLFSAGCPG